ncbi:signal peptidase II Aspartic peptidase. MEROPS family A08 [Persephonella hydrogeniphila]|uniref:Lipoprotein signal peptidase n=1 Tax=Persephonella hydrogeniphila TaxID=198703 RepID=A0A285NMA2_9AQUI|nr:signal peptidase II [Persephonella hydrogeniphila]SNZ10599.1 signal peptidase II Aspartic peptidase. MEROPS family A08 [Persephonella hydrogeniphila]
MDRKFSIFLIIFISVVFLDLITKEIAVRFLSSVGRISVIPGFFDLTLVWNRGAAFGILGEAPEIIRKLVLIGASSIAAIVTVIYSYKKRFSLSYWEIVFLALIAGGAVGNLYDRIFIGAVRDFLDFYIKNYHWPAFNIADSAISIGIFGFIIYEIFFRKKS